MKNCSSLYFLKIINFVHQNIFEESGKKVLQLHVYPLIIRFVKIRGRTIFQEVNMVFDKVKEIIVDQLDVEESSITPETSLTKDLEADSLDAVEIIMSIEDEYEIEIPDEEAEKFSNIGDIVAFIEEKIAEKE